MSPTQELLGFTLDELSAVVFLPIFTHYVGKVVFLHPLRLGTPRLATSSTFYARPRDVLLGPPLTESETNSLPPIYRR